MTTQKLMKKIASENGTPRSHEWFATTPAESKRLLKEAVAYQKYYGRPTEIKILVLNWLADAWVVVSQKAANDFIRAAFDEGEGRIRDYEWIDSGHVQAKISPRNFGITVRVSCQDVVRNDREAVE